MGGIYKPDESVQVRRLNEPTPQFFDSWATDEDGSYDEDTQYIMHYVAPMQHIEFALPFLRESPIGDVGAGTGLLGEPLVQRGFVVDGVAPGI